MLFRSLEYENDLPYELIHEDTFKAWSYSDFEGRSVSVVDSLSSAMRANPHLKVHVAFGHYDGATPYYAAEHVLARLQVPEELRDNIDTAYYPAGHMMYVNEGSLKSMKADMADFVSRTSR